MKATMDDMRALLTAQMSKDPNQTLHRVRALAFGDAPAVPAPAVATEPEEKKGIFSKKTSRKKVDSD